MRLFHFTKTQKSSILSLLLGGFLLFGSIIPAFTNAAILVTGGGYVEDETNNDYTIHYDHPHNNDDNEDYLASASHPLCHDDSCHIETTTTRPHVYTTTTTRPVSYSYITPTTTHPLCHDDTCHVTTTTTTKPSCTTTTSTTTTTICPIVTTNIHTTNSFIPYNSSALLHWSSTNANSCIVSASPYNSQWNGSIGLNGTKGINNITKTTTFSITCSNSCGSTDTKSTVVHVQPEPTRYSCNTSTWQCVIDNYGPYTSLSDCQANCQPINQSLSVSCYASPSSAQINQTVTFYSNVSGGSGNYTYQWSGVASGYQSYSQRSFSNTGTQTAYLTVYDSQGRSASTSCNAYIENYNNPISVSCYASPSSAQINQTVTFYSNASGGSGNYTYQWSGVASGYQSYSQRSFSNTGTQTAYLTVYDSQGRSASTSCNAYIGGGQCTNPPTVNLWADKYTINQEETTYLRWVSSNTSYCVASNGWSGNKATSGYEAISPDNNTTYNITCYGYDNCGQVSQSITIYTTSTGTNLSLTKLGRNLSSGGRVYSKNIQAAQGDVIEFYLTVSAGSNKNLYNVVVKDILPTNLNYRPGTTKIDGIVQADTIITTGLSLGTLNQGTTKNISFQAINTAPVFSLSYTNTAEATANNENKVTDSATIIHGIVAGAATVVTGAEDYFLISLVVSFILALLALYYLNFNTKGKMTLAAIENKTRNAYLSYARYQLKNKK